MVGPASRRNEAAIWVTANACSRLGFPPVTRVLPFDRLVPLLAGRRGTKGRRTAATRARIVPTQSMLASTVRSSARTEKRDAYLATTVTIGPADKTPTSAP